MPWPTHADGRNKKVGEMTDEERRVVFDRAIKRTQAHFDRPEVRAALATVLASDPGCHSARRSQS